MWIEKTKTGLRLCDRYKGYDGRLHKASVPLSKDTPQARKKASEELLNRIAVNCANVDNPSLKWLISRYLSSKDAKPSTIANYTNAFSQMQIIFGDIPISMMTAPYIKRHLSESDKQPKTLNRYLTLLHDFLAWCADQGYIESIPQVKKFQDKSPKRDPSQEYLEADELKAVLDQVEGSIYFYLVKFLSLTGCRIGEASALTINDIDDKYIHITKAYKSENGISTPKTTSSVRDIYIQPELSALLKEYKEWRLLYMMAHKIRTDLLFFSIRGTILTESTFKTKLTRLECEKHLHPHIFRHTHTALLAEQGLPLELIARRLGHVDSTITKRIYFHVTEKIKEKDEKALDKVSIL